MPKSFKTIVYIDGENLIHRVMEALQPTHKSSRNQLINLRLRWFMENLTAVQGANLDIRYYTTRLKLAGLSDDMQERLRLIADFNSNFIPRLISQDVHVVRAGILRVRETEPCKKCGATVSYFIEKGVDVRLGVDMMKDAHKKDVGQLVLVSSDMDLLPAVAAARELGKHVSYAGYASQINTAMSASANATLTFTDKDIQRALMPDSTKGKMS